MTINKKNPHNINAEFLVSFLFLLVYAISFAVAPNSAALLILTLLFAVWNVIFYRRIKSLNSLHSNLLSLIPVFVIILFVPPAVLASLSDDASYTSFKFSIETITGDIVSQILFLGLLGMQSFSMGIGVHHRKKGEAVLLIKNERYLIYLPLVLITFSASVALRIHQIGSVSDGGFSSIYTEGVSGNIFLTILTYLFYAIIPIAFISTKNKSFQKFLIIILLIESILHALIGQRVWLVFGVIQSVFLMNVQPLMVRMKIVKWLGGNKITKSFLMAVIIVFLVIIMQYSLAAREGIEFELEGLGVVANFLVGQTGTFTAFGLAIQNHDFAFGSNIPPILDPINFNRESIQSAVSQSTTNLGSRITYLSCTSCFLDGRSYGTSVFIQLYQWYALGIIAGSYFLGILARIIFIKYQLQSFFIIVGFFLIRHFVWLPRGDFFPHFYTFLTILVSIVLLITINSFVRLFVIRDKAMATRVIHGLKQSG